MKLADSDTYAVGTIWRTSWGYDQTNVEFFEVVKRNAASVVVRRLAATTGEGPYPKVFPATGPDRFCTDWSLMGNSECWDRESGPYPNPVYVRDKERGYSEKLCMLPRGSKRWPERGDYARLVIDNVRTAWPYEGEGAYDTIAAGLPGH